MKLMRHPRARALVAAVVAFARRRPAGAREQATARRRLGPLAHGHGLAAPASAVPNRAAFSFGVTTQARPLPAALNANGAEMRR